MIHARPDYNRIQDPAGLIPEDEPVFLIRAQDELGADIVDAWAMLNEKNNGDHKLTELARDHAARMRAWPKKKKADL